MQSMLEALYRGEREFCSHEPPVDSGYEKALQETQSLQEALENKLTLEMQATFESFLEMYEEKLSYEWFAYFKEGFCTGTRIMAEAMQGE